MQESIMNDVEFGSQLVASISPLRAFGRSLCRDSELLDDLVQQTLLRAWAARASYRMEGSVRSWLFTILRHCCYEEYERFNAEVADPGGAHAEKLALTPDHEVQEQVRGLDNALQRLPHEQRDALALVVFRGLSYAEVGTVCDCKIGTVRSRVARARAQLSDTIVDL
jgi:RNA polymerase sigma-70 factor (ECF subfamily)